MAYTLKVQTKTQIPFFTDENIFVEQFNNKQEVQAVLNLCNSARRIDWLESLIVPVRTDNLKNFCKDFFLPGILNVAIRTNNYVSNVWSFFIFSFLDLVTFPCRIITVIPRYLYNKFYPKESHLYYKYLVNKGVHIDTLSQGYVYLRLEKDDMHNQEKFETKLDLVSPFCTLNFIGLPKYCDFNCGEAARLMEFSAYLKLAGQGLSHTAQRLLRYIDLAAQNGEELSQENRALVENLRIQLAEANRVLGVP